MITLLVGADGKNVEGGLDGNNGANYYVSVNQFPFCCASASLYITLHAYPLNLIFHKHNKCFSFLSPLKLYIISKA